jgi:hypothetical protein
MPATYEPIATTTLSSAASTITFSSIGSGYTDLRVIFSALGTTGAGQYANMRFNSDTGSNYSHTRLKQSNTSILSQRTSNTTSIWLMDGAELHSTIPTFCTIDVFSYAGSTNKTALVTESSDRNSTSSSQGRYVGLWRNTAAITSITLLTTSGNFAIGTTATLYGILKA